MFTRDLFDNNNITFLIVWFHLTKEIVRPEDYL